MKQVVVLGILLALLSACNERYEGYTSEGEINYMLCAFGESDLTLSTAEHVRLSIGSKKLGESYFTYETIYNFQGLDIEYLGCQDLVNVVKDRVAGDSLSIITPFSCIKEGLLDEFSVDGYELADTTVMQVDIGILRLQTAADYHSEQRALIQKGILEENEFLKSYLDDAGILDSCIVLQDAYMLPLVENDAEKLVSGQEIALSYQGFQLDGTEFDSSDRSGQLLYFQIGKPDQVVPAINLALRKMGEGESARIYSPSHMAFGQDGSSRAKVPPLTPVYFEIRVDTVYTIATP